MVYVLIRVDERTKKEDLLGVYESKDLVKKAVHKAIDSDPLFVNPLYYTKTFELNKFNFITE